METMLGDVLVGATLLCIFIFLHVRRLDVRRLMIEVIKYIIIILHSLKYTRAFICVPNPPVQDKASHLKHVCTARDS